MLPYLLSVSVYMYSLLYTSDYWHADSFSELQPKRTEHLDGCIGPAKAVHCTALRPRVFQSVSFHSPSFTSLRPKPHSWPNMAWSHQSDASDTSAIPQRWKQRRRRSPFCSHGFWNGIEETLSREMREARHHKRSVRERGFCSWFGLKPQELGFTAKSLSRTDVTSAG